MAQYSYIGYEPTVVSFVGGVITLSASFDPDLDRRIFDVTDGEGGTVLDGMGNVTPDDGTTFHGDRFNNEDGDDLTQTGVVTDLDGTVLVPSGNMYLEESFTLAKPGGGTIELFAVEVDGTLVGYITSEPLDPGVSYTFTTSNVTPTNAPDTTDPTVIIDVPCFCAGTMIRTPQGDRKIDELKAGDQVITGSDTPRTIRWIGQRTILPPFATRNDLWPVRIAAHSFAYGAPERDLFVSPNHRILVSSPWNTLFFGDETNLVAAKFLVGLPGIEQLTDLARVSYFHMLFDQHEIVWSNGVPSESLYLGDMTLRGMAKAAHDEITTIFPELENEEFGTYGPVAAPELKRYEASLLSLHL